MRKIAVMAALALSLMAARSYAQFPAAPGTGPGLAETIEAIDSARVTTRILYVTAHPDDERADVLTYLARGLHADVALLSLTRGEGGQNALGPEQAPQLGLIRTQELLAATRGYGVKLYFTRAKDFGFSKTPEETEKVWGDQVLEDMVRVIREFRPNIVINNWGGVHGGHGHHQAAGLLTPIAVQRAADANAYPEQLKERLAAWGGADNEVVILDLDRSDKPAGYILPLDEVSPVWGKSWREIGLDAFANHRTQGVSVFLGSPFFRRPLALKREDGKAFDPRSLAIPITELFPKSSCVNKVKAFCDRIADSERFIIEAKENARKLDWVAATNSLLAAKKSAHSLLPPCDIIGLPWPVDKKTINQIADLQTRLQNAINLAAGFKVTAETTRTNVVRGDLAEITVRYSCRPGVECPGRGPMPLRGQPTGVETVGRDSVMKYSTTFEAKKREDVLDTLEPLREPAEKQVDPADATRPLPSPAETAYIRINDHPVCIETRAEPVVHVEAESTRVERVPIRIVPAFTVAVEPKQEIEKLAAKHEPFYVFLRVHSYSQKAATVSAGLDVPAGWESSGTVDVSFAGEGDRYAKLTVTPPAKMDAGHYTITAYAKRGEEKFTTSIEPLVSMPTLTWEEPAQTVVHAFDIKVPENLRVGYISAESEPVPDALKMLGIKVEMLDANALNFGDLSKYDAIVVGVRAYELRSELPGANQRLLDYAQNGGTLVVQYQRDFAWDGKNYSPYPAKIANKQGDPLPRITDETSPVKFLKPDDPLLNAANKITQDDFKGWVQERGLYFWSEYDSRYTPLLAMNDPGEKDLDGALLYTKLGKGTYIYTGIAFFRQLPEGVPGAYRLFVNLLSASRSR